MAKPGNNNGTSAFNRVILSCEHASNYLPEAYRKFIPDDLDFFSLLNSHRGFDDGALDLAREISRRSKVKIHEGKVTRLLVDLNRSLTSATLHYKVFRRLTVAQRSKVIELFYTPHREAIAFSAQNKIKQYGSALHFSIHSFTPILNGKTRKCDIGILFNPKRASEMHAAKLLRKTLSTTHPDLTVWFNHPYRGSTDGMTTWMRKRHPQQKYCGIEIELNQRLVNGRDKRGWPKLRSSLAEALCAFLGDQKP